LPKKGVVAKKINRKWGEGRRKRPFVRVERKKHAVELAVKRNRSAERKKERRKRGGRGKRDPPFE